MQNQTLADDRFDIPGREVHVWPVLIAASDVIAARFQRLLAPDEKARASRFRFDQQQRSFILSRGALRVLMGRYLGIAPADIRFNYGAKGKPYIEEPACIKFNVSHSGVFALFAFTIGCEIGIDVEQVRPLKDMLQIAHRFFCPEEATELVSLPAGERERAFFLCWTRKEAYIKASGDGLSAPLDGCRVTLRPSEPARFLHVSHDTTSRLWSLHNIAPAPQYAAALVYNDAPRPVHVLPQVSPAELPDILNASRTAINARARCGRLLNPSTWERIHDA